MPKSKKQKKHLDRLSKLLIAGIIVLSFLFIGSVMLLLNYGRFNSASSNQDSVSSHISGSFSRSNKVDNRQQRSAKKKTAVKNVSADVANQNVQQGLPLALTIMQSTKALPGEQIDFNLLGSDNTKKLYACFVNPAPIQQFNDIVNYGSQSGVLQHGDAGTSADGQVQTPKPGDSYTIDQADVQLSDRDGGNYVFTVAFKYHANSDSPRTVPLKITCQKIDGKIASIEQNGQFSY
ncbi:hypothetical protein ACLUWZ_06225 [Limosilactobacillus mucosae]|uniref:hypothetical protein n=1 Tax=Limosilactobacillus mucosae TaxID=97478 RepID=UPI003994E3CF